MKRMKILYVAAAVVLLGATVFSTACKDEKTYGEVGKEIEFVDSDVTLCENGTSAYKVVVPVDATVSVNWAANELVTYIERSTGVRLPIVSDVTVTAFNTAEKYISLGGTELFENSGVTVSETELTTDGYKIVRMDNTVFINGVTDWGTSFGVMEFLHHEIGYEPY
ncbi:MAG: hypothetical protein IJB97_10065, partial [Clostridia bacterium]|nr:hypothetical protein [Clostridia bacterium]